jgi:hypothetical protein
MLGLPQHHYRARCAREKKQRAPVPENPVAKNRHRIFRPRAAAGLQCVPAARRRRRSSKLSRQFRRYS